MADTKIDMQRDFSRYPIGRYKKDGPHSGERFREEILLPHLKKNERIEVNLDSGLSYGSSFLEEAFGGLVRAGLTVDFINTSLVLVSKDQTLLDEIAFYIDDAAKNG
jgi:hypothetical protein